MPAFPRYSCHKTVAAIRIHAVQDPYLVWRDDDAELHNHSVGLSWILQHKPHAGGYYVVSNGVDAFVPAEIFEAEYARMRCNGHDNGVRCWLDAEHAGLCRY